MDIEEIYCPFSQKAWSSCFSDNLKTKAKVKRQRLSLRAETEISKPMKFSQRGWME